MKISGWQKVTLLDYPEKVACTIFTNGCNFRCPFCHNPELVIRTNEAPVIPEEEVLEFLRERQGKLDGVCITGGEPLVHQDIAQFMRQIKELGFLIKLDTNGSFPERLKALAKEKLIDYVAIDIKNSKEKYAQTIGVKNFNIKPVEESVEFLMKGELPYEFRTTLVKEFHTLVDMEKIATWIGGARAYFLQNFVDSGDLIGENLHGLSRDEMWKFYHHIKDSFSLIELRGIN